jgi:hypothetical protein
MIIPNTFRFYQEEFVWTILLEKQYDAFTTNGVISDLRIYKSETFLLIMKTTDILIYDTKFYLTLERWNKILGKRYKQ